MLRRLSVPINHVAKSPFIQDSLSQNSRIVRPISMTSPTDITKDSVVHDAAQSEFYIHLKDSAGEGKAFLQYRQISPDYVDLEHTVVPVEFRGRGVAKVLAQTVFDHFVEKGTHFRPTCTYLQKFYNENQLPQYKDKVKWD